jgi:hypothetical protein
MDGEPSVSDEHVMYMPAEQFDELVRTLDEPDDFSGLLMVRRFHGVSDTQESNR